MTGRALVTGAAGFIGRRLVGLLRERGREVRGVDRDVPADAPAGPDAFLEADLRDLEACREAVAGVGEVFHLAADTGGIGPFTSTHASVCRNNTTMNLNLLTAASEAGVDRLLFASSACVYPRTAGGREAEALCEEDAWPADPEPGHGEEKLFAERLCAHYRADTDLETRVVRLGDVHGPGAAFAGGRVTELAALCRKVAVTAERGTITLWGDGRERRSYLHLEDCVEGLWRVMHSGCPGPLNLASDRTATMAELADLVVAASGRRVNVEFDPTKPGPGPRPTLDISRLRRTLGWEPRVGLEEGVADTYRSIEERARDTAAAHRHPGPPHLP